MRRYGMSKEEYLKIKAEKNKEFIPLNLSFNTKLIASILFQITRLNNELQQRILEKKIALEIEEEEILKVDQILEKAGTLEIYA